MKRLISMLLSGVMCLAGAVTALAAEYPYLDLNTSKIEGTVEIERFNEAPELRVKVAAGELPPIEKRLPEEPLVVKPAEEIGQYGGAWRQGHIGRSDLAQNAYHVNELLVCW